MRKEFSSCRKFCYLVLIVAVLALADQVYAGWQTVGAVTRVTRSKTNGVVLDTTSRAKVLIEFFDLDVVRFLALISTYLAHLALNPDPGRVLALFE